MRLLSGRSPVIPPTHTPITFTASQWLIHPLQDFEYLPPSIPTSASDGSGKGQLLNFIGALRVAAEQKKR